VLVEVGTAIIDGADVASDHDKGVFALSEIGDLLEVEEAGEAMTLLREMFARRVQKPWPLRRARMTMRAQRRSPPLVKCF
jgi:hypothetical protein